jgi:hypothetical protein
MGVVGLKLAEKARAMHPSHKPRNCILIQLAGGPSQLETFDPKPEAPREIRGPLRSIQTSIPSVSISESLPKIAERMDQMTLIRSLSHREAPIHETGLQLLHTGRLARGNIQYPSFGSVIKRIFGEEGESFAVLPGHLSGTGVNTWRGQGAGSPLIFPKNANRFVHRMAIIVPENYCCKLDNLSNGEHELS